MAETVRSFSTRTTKSFVPAEVVFPFEDFFWLEELAKGNYEERQCEQLCCEYQDLFTDFCDLSISHQLTCPGPTGYVQNARDEQVNAEI
jgi:hypothetical protein